MVLALRARTFHSARCDMNYFQPMHFQKGEKSVSHPHKNALSSTQVKKQQQQNTKARVFSALQDRARTMPFNYIQECGKERKMVLLPKGREADCRFVAACRVRGLQFFNCCRGTTKLTQGSDKIARPKHKNFISGEENVNKFTG